MVQSESIYVCLSRPQGGVRPSAILAVALQCPMQVLSTNTDDLRFQAQEIVDWFFGGPDPQWLPEHLLDEEVEEFVEIEIDDGRGGSDDDEDDDDFEYEISEEYVGS